MSTSRRDKFRALAEASILNTPPPTPAESRRNKIQATAFILMLFLVGPVVFGIGVALASAENAVFDTGERVSGTVAVVEEGAAASWNRLGVDFTAADGSAHTVWRMWSPGEKPEVGQSVEVFYLADDPGSAVVEGYDGWGEFTTGLGAVLSLVLGAAGLIMVFSFRRGARRRKRLREQLPAPR